MTTHILTLDCRNRPGIVAAVAGAIAKHGGDIVQAAQFDDATTGRFFMRVQFQMDSSVAPVRLSFDELARTLDLTWQLRDAELPRRVLLLVSKFDHCLIDLLYRIRIGEMAIEVSGIVSNHPVTQSLAAHIGEIPFYHLPITKETKPAQEARIREIVEQTDAELVVLARYMQVLSNEMSRFLEGRCINIHHSFLPGFKGAKPYNQAFDRGVKMIGATAHYVTGDLDEGPIIAQDVEQVSHADGPSDLINRGRDIERRVLARAVRLHIEDRVLLNGTKTVVFA